MSDIHIIIEKHKAALLSLPGCTAVAIGKKAVAGTTTDTDSIVVFVQKKGQVAPSDAIPAQLDGIPTDVVERAFGFLHTATDPFERFDPLISGVSLASLEDPQSYGSIGCFISVDGHMPQVPAGTYLLTNQHVLQVAATGGDRRAIQPGNIEAPPDGYVVGLYLFGLLDATHDCAVASIGRRGFDNEVPNHPWHPGLRALAGVATAALNDRVYKYGATTTHTVGTVTHINFNAAGINNAIYIQGEGNGLWCAGGDSGSVAIRYADDYVLGLNFRADALTPVAGGFSCGLAYDIATQMQVFGTTVRLA